MPSIQELRAAQKAVKAAKKAELEAIQVQMAELKQGQLTGIVTISEKAQEYFSNMNAENFDVKDVRKFGSYITKWVKGDLTPANEQELLTTGFIQNLEKPATEETTTETETTE